MCGTENALLSTANQKNSQVKRGVPVFIAWAGGSIPLVGSSSGYTSANCQ